MGLVRVRATLKTQNVDRDTYILSTKDVLTSRQRELNPCSGVERVKADGVGRWRRQCGFCKMG